MTSFILNIAAALPCEAAPLIDYFRLKKIVDRRVPFSMFVNADKNIHLIVTGVGKIKCAAAVSFLAGFTHYPFFASFLNIGVAGSEQFLVEDALLANKIIENTTKRAWYPFVTSLKHLRQTELVTHDLPQLSYPAKGMIDMEGSAFFQTASCFVSQEHIHSIKIISDNDIQSQKEINKRHVIRLIENNLSIISEVASYLINLSTKENQYAENEEQLGQFYSTWHFTHAEKIQLKESLRRWKGQFNQDPWTVCQDEKNAKQVINKIKEKLDHDASCLY